MASNEGTSPTLPRGLLGRKGTPVDRNMRLPSLKSQRDLTLGGNNANKRVFMPNIPVRRDRTQPSPAPAAEPTPVKKESFERGRGRGRGDRGRGRGRPEYIQSTGAVFSEGIAESTVKKGWGGRDSSGGGEAQHHPKPTIDIKKIHVKVDKEDDERKLNLLLRDDFIDDDEPQLSKDLQPVHLPMYDCIKKEVKDEDKKLKPEKMDTSETVKIKTEKMDVDETPESTKTDVNQKEPVVYKTAGEEVSASRLFTESNGSGKLLFFQFPDCMPGLLESDDKRPRKPTTVSSSEGTSNQTAADKEEGPPEEKLFKLGDMNEGYIGKLQVCKSGRTKLVIGNVKFDVETGTQVGFLQDLMSVRVEEQKGHMTILGQVPHRLVCFPDMDQLFIS